MDGCSLKRLPARFNEERYADHAAVTIENGQKGKNRTLTFKGPWRGSARRFSQPGFQILLLYFWKSKSKVKYGLFLTLLLKLYFWKKWLTLLYFYFWLFFTFETHFTLLYFSILSYFWKVKWKVRKFKLKIKLENFLSRGALMST